MYLKSSAIIVISFLLLSCGEGKVTIDPDQYDPKIAIEAFLFPHKRVTRVFIWRNFPVDANLQRLDLSLPYAQVTIMDLETGDVYPLRYIPDYYYFEYVGNKLVIDYGKSYRLDVSASIDGKRLSASSTTTIPNPGMEIVSINFDTLKYRQRDANDNIINFLINMERSPGTNFYLATILAENATIDNFIYDNPFTDESPEDVAADLADYRYNYNWIQDTPLTAGQSRMELFWYLFWFYDRYKIIIYAADKNYQDFLKTYNDVQEIDGNFHEPLFHIEGDGIGVFGSAVIDTIYVNVVP